MGSQQLEQRKEAVRDLVKFISDYTELLQGQIQSIKGDMASIVDEVMESVKSLNNAQIEKTKMAESILLKGNDEVKTERTDKFKEYSAKLKNEVESETFKKANVDVSHMMSTNVKKVGNELREHMKSLENLDSKMQELILTMVGAMSADDVVGQRIDHVSFALDKMSKELSGIVQDFETKFVPTQVEHFGLELNKAVFSKYTIPDERECFIKVQGYNPNSKK